MSLPIDPSPPLPPSPSPRPHCPWARRGRRREGNPPVEPEPSLCLVLRTWFPRRKPSTQVGCRGDSQFLHPVPTYKPRSILNLWLPPPRLRRFVKSHSGWWLRGKSDPMSRYDLLSVSTKLMIKHQLLHSSTDDSKPELGRRFPSHPRLPRGTPGGYSVASYQPCLLLIHCRDWLDFPFQGFTQDAFFTRTTLCFLTSASAGTSPVSTNLHNAINSLRARATIPTFRSRVFPWPKRLWYH